MKTIIFSNIHVLLCALLLALPVSSCDKDAHEDEYPLPDGQGAVVVGLQTAAPGTEVGELTLWLFDSDGNLSLRRNYDDPRALASQYLSAAAGSYTIAVAANADADALPQQTTPADLAQWLKDHADGFPDLLTASVQTEVGMGGINRLLLTLKAGTDGLALSAVRLLLTVPETKMPDYPSTRAAAEVSAEVWQLRCVAEVYRGGTDTPTHRRELLCERQADGRYAAELFLLPGDYDLRLWTDYTDEETTGGKYYTADDLSAVTVRTGNYLAGEATDTKDAHYAVLSLTVDGESTDREIELTRPFARYRLVATDVEAYVKLMEKENYPPIENLEVRVGYKGFFPTGFDVATGRPNDALTGISYTTVPVGADGFDKAEALQVGGDFVLTNGEESFVTATVEIIDRTTGETVSRTAGVKIPYRRGHLTTVTGHFLTAGKTTGGVQIDTGWGDEIIVEF